MALTVTRQRKPVVSSGFQCYLEVYLGGLLNYVLTVLATSLFGAGTVASGPRRGSFLLPIIQ